MEWARKADDRGYGGKMVVDLRFVKEGADFLRRVYAQGEVQAAARLQVEQCNRSTYQYYVAFEADFNFSQYEDYRHRDASYVACQLLEVNSLSDMEGAQKAVYELNMPDRVTVSQTANAINTATWIREYKKGDTIYHYGAPIQSEEITSNFIRVKSPSVNPDEILTDWMMELKPNANIAKSPKLKLTYKIGNIRSNVGSGITLKSFYILADDPDKIIQPGPDIWTVKPAFEDIGKTLEGEVTVDAIPEPLGSNKIWMVNVADFLDEGRPGTEKQSYPAFSNDLYLRIDMSVLAEPLVQPFSFPAIRLMDLGRELLARVRPGYTFASNLLEGDAILSTTFAASGDAIRNVEGAKLKTSWKDFKESVNKLHPICLQIDTANKVVRLEDIEQAYRKDVEIVDLGKVERLSVEPFLDDSYTLINIGISDPDYNLVNGRFEFNNEYQYKTALNVLSKEGDFLCKYRTDSFGVTAARYEAEQSETTDGKTDNSIFLIHCNGNTDPVPYTGHQLLGDDTQLQRTGIFNVGLSPGRCLRRQARLLLTGLRKVSHTLTWQTSAKTGATLVSRFQDPLTGGWDEVAEKADVMLEGEPLFIAKKVKFIARIPKHLPELMSQNVGGYISFTWQGKRYKGFPMQVAQRPVAHTEQEVYVTLHPETDIA